MAVMRVAAGMYVAIALLSCAAEEVHMENRLDLTLGGDNRSLREDLRRLDETMGLVPRRQPRRQPEPRLRRQPRPEPAHAPEPGRQPPPSSSPPLQVVVLEEGDTLWGLAEAHLGAGRRWRELARFNGWSEDRASSLPTGTRVKLPPH